MLHRFIYILIILCKNFSLFGQEYSYQHYDLTNGLSGLTVYSITQDKKNYLWFGTETGVSRFDGSNFKNFTTSDGLPDNEVLKVYADSKNRVWILPFTNAICYYENGIIYNARNDTTLAKIKFKSEPFGIKEDAEGNIIIIERTIIHIIGSDGNIYEYSNFNKALFSTVNAGINEKGNVEVYTGIYTDNWGLLEIDRKLRSPYFYKQLSDNGKLVNALSFIEKGSLMAYRKSSKIIIQSKNYRDSFAAPLTFVGFSIINDSLLTLNCNNNVLLYNVFKKKIIDTFFIGKTTNICFKDSEGNYWFATTGYGIYRLTSIAFKSFFFPFEKNYLPVYSIARLQNELLVGTNYGLLWSINLNTEKEIKKTDFKITQGEGRITSLLINKDKIVAGVSGINILSPGRLPANYFKGYTIKNISNFNDSIFVATNIYLFKTTINNPNKVDTIWRTRSTCSYKINNEFYIGTINGLYCINQTDTEYLGKKIPLLSTRISALSSSGNILWIATYGNGVIAFADNKIVAHITAENGLTSNMCRNLAITREFLWVGTDKGLNKISLKNPTSNILNYTTSNGLSCDIVNCVYVDNDSIFVGTPYGLTFFDPAQVDNFSIAVLNVDNILSKKYKWSSNSKALNLSPEDNRLSVEFSCVSFKSQGNITYYYKLTGADQNWHHTTENKLDFASLSPGDYTLELYAINAFDKKSNGVKINFTIDKFFYQELWFILLVTTTALMILLFFILKWIKRIRKNENEKLQTQKRLSELEQLAFRAQMNPHFIFNCLNSIQQYIFSKNELDANRFITDFASLIRQTMDLSVNKVISLEEEIRYLTTYLKLEHTRFEENFDYKISADADINQESVYLPSMFLQPFVENSIRHGIRNLKNKKGVILISFFVKDNLLVCVIEDNGVGRASSKALKTYDNTGHESKGIALIERRIEVLNIEQKEKIKLTVKDGFQNEPDKGTTVVLQVPIYA